MGGLREKRNPMRGRFRMDGWMDGWMDGGKLMEKREGADERMDGERKGGSEAHVREGRSSRFRIGRLRETMGLIRGRFRMDGWMGGWMDEWIDG